MTQKDEALKLAIEAFKDCHENEGVYYKTAIETCKAALSEPESVMLPDGWVANPDTIPAQLIEITRQAICLEFGDSGTDGYYKRILAKIFKAMLQAAPTLNEKG